MATIKAFTDIEQSKKLAKILPIESADMSYSAITEGMRDKMIIKDWEVTIGLDPAIKNNLFSYRNGYVFPCWSLAALLAILPNEILTDDRFECHYQIDIRKYDGGDNTTLYQIAYGNNRGLSGSWHDMINTGEKENLIDACYDMIIILKEMNLL